MAMVAECDCDDWRENIFKLLSPYLLSLAAIGEYQGKKMTHCPWCGKELVLSEYGNDYSQCTCGTERFHSSTGGCPVHGTNEFGNEL